MTENAYFDVIQISPWTEIDPRTGQKSWRV
jgi:hypothetical protein